MTDFLGLDIYDYYISNLFQIFAIILLSGIILGQYPVLSQLEDI